jgi:MFS family permease
MSDPVQVTGPCGGQACQQHRGAYLAFAVFGAFWGAWGASIPAAQAAADVSDGQLGLALVGVGVGALPTMLLAGRALDRFGLRVLPLSLTLLGAVGLGVAALSTNLPTLVVGLLLVGITSGAADVGLNTFAGRAEQLSGRPVITRAHGAFSAAAVGSSLLTAASSAAAAPFQVPFLAVACFALVASGYLLSSLPRPAPGALVTCWPAGQQASHHHLLPLLAVGALGALACAIENAFQSWGAVYVSRELAAGPGLTEIAPAVFAAAVAVTRLTSGGLVVVRSSVVVAVGAGVAAAGAIGMAASQSTGTAFVGLGTAAAGTAILLPTLLGVVARNTDEARRGGSTSLVTTVSYLGFLVGPAYVGVSAQAVGLRGAMIAVAAVGVILCVAAPMVLHRAEREIATGRAERAPRG